MIIKYPALTAQLKQPQPAVYIVMGQDPYLLNEAACRIKHAWRTKGESETSTWSLATTEDWTALINEANNYSLFSDYVLLDAHYEKKTLDAAAKTCLSDYSQDPNPRTLVLIRAPQVPPKQWQWLARHERLIAVQAAPLTASAFSSWISQQLKEKALQAETAVPALIAQYTQGNLLAAAQVIEKLALTCDTHTRLTKNQVLEQLSDQCEYQLYELADACLLANAAKAIHLLRYAHDSKVEATLVLWLLTQEIRQLIQLTYLLKSHSFTAACQQLNIWSQRTQGYQLSVARLSLQRLHELLQNSQRVDEAIKTSQQDIWQSLEQLALGLAGKC